MTKTFNQYLAIKEKYPEAILLCRIGDYYIATNDDAIIVAKHTGITLEKEKRNGGVKAVAKVHLTSIDSAMRKLIKAGNTVALCDSLESPRKAQGISNRAVNK